MSMWDQYLWKRYGKSVAIALANSHPPSKIIQALIDKKGLSEPEAQSLVNQVIAKHKTKKENKKSQAKLPKVKLKAPASFHAKQIKNKQNLKTTASPPQQKPQNISPASTASSTPYEIDTTNEDNRIKKSKNFKLMMPHSKPHQTQIFPEGFTLSKNLLIGILLVFLGAISFVSIEPGEYYSLSYKAIGMSVTAMIVGGLFIVQGLFE